uniref:Chloride conductance regulatory protein ICln n=1 Tax=Arundo donax TaxID=35708 RepID=A0A0A9BCP9_ARUDO
MVLGLYPFTHIAADGAPRLDAAAGEELVRVERAAALALGLRAPETPGTLFLTTRRLIWVSEAEKGKAYAVDFVAVSLHAVSRDPEAYPSPCIYTQIETEDGSDEESDESDCETNGEIELSKVTEMRIIPSDPGQYILFVANCLIKIFVSFKQVFISDALQI